MEYPEQAREFKHPYDQSVATYKGHSVLRTLIRCYFSPEYRSTLYMVFFLYVVYKCLVMETRFLIVFLLSSTARGRSTSIPGLMTPASTFMIWYVL